MKYLITLLILLFAGCELISSDVEEADQAARDKKVEESKTDSSIVLTSCDTFTVDTTRRAEFKMIPLLLTPILDIDIDVAEGTVAVDMSLTNTGNIPMKMVSARIATLGWIPPDGDGIKDKDALVLTDYAAEGICITERTTENYGFSGVYTVEGAELLNVLVHIVFTDEAGILHEAIFLINVSGTFEYFVDTDSDFEEMLATFEKLYQ